ncbi:MAG TPA: hypothetical protein VIY68_05315 [Steroidobacteraceae bacterium]
MNKFFLRLSLLLLVLTSGFVYSGPDALADYDSVVQQGKAQLQAGSAEQALTSGRSAIKMIAGRWEGYALAGGALMNLKRYEEAADTLSDAIKRAPESKQPALRDLRRQCLQVPSTTVPVNAAPSLAATTQAEIVLWKSIEHSKNPADFQAYVEQYPQGAFVNLAKNHITAILHPLQKGEWCVLNTAAPGDVLQRQNDYTFAIVSISSKSDRCSNQQLLAIVEIRPGAKSHLSHAQIRLPQGFLTQPLDPADVVDGVVVVASNKSEDISIMGQSIAFPSANAPDALDALVDFTVKNTRSDAIVFNTSPIERLEINGMRARRFTKEIRWKTSGAWTRHLVEVSTVIEADSELFLLRAYSKNDKDKVDQAKRFAYEVVSFAPSSP